MALKLPAGAEAVLRIEATDAFDRRFAINVEGAGRSGWFFASHRASSRNQDSGVQRSTRAPSISWEELLVPA